MGAGAARSFRSFVFSMRFDKQAIATVLGRQVVSEARIFAQAATANFARLPNVAFGLVAAFQQLTLVGWAGSI